MELGVSGFQVGDGELQVTLGGRQRAVPKQVLNVAQIGVVLDQVRGAGVTPDVRRDVFLDLGEPGVTLDQVADGVRVNGFAPERKE